MKSKWIRFVVGLLTGLIALTAISGGILLLVGVDTFPLEWLSGTPFTDYTIPGLALLILVGGSSLLATILLVTRRRAATASAFTAGVIMAVYIGVEVLLLKQVPPGPTVIEGIYFGLGLVIILLAAYLWLAELRSPQDRRFERR